MYEWKAPGAGFINISDKLGLILSLIFGDETLSDKPFHEENTSVDIREIGEYRYYQSIV